jgi:hypothetical protein
MLPIPSIVFWMTTFRISAGNLMRGKVFSVAIGCPDDAVTAMLRSLKASKIWCEGK